MARCTQLQFDRELSRVNGSQFVKTALSRFEIIADMAVRAEAIHVHPNPILIWPIPGYFPPPQRSNKNKNGFRRSAEVARLREQRAMQQLVKEVYYSGQPANEKSKRLVLIAAWKERTRYDSGNFVQACKALLDSLQPDVIRDDDNLHCVNRYFQDNVRNQPKELKMGTGTLVVVWEIVALEVGESAIIRVPVPVN